MTAAWCPALTFAQTSWREDATDGSWANANNWTDGIPSASKPAVFSTSDITTTAINGDKFALGVSFVDEGDGINDFTVNTGSGGVLYLYANGLTVGGGEQTFNCNVRPRNSLTIANDGAGLLNLNGAIRVHLLGAGSATLTFDGDGDIRVARYDRRTSGMNVDLVKQGSGTLTIAGAVTQPAGTGDGAINGSMSILGGTVSINNEANLGADLPVFNPAGLLLNDGALRATASFTIDDANRGITLGAAGGTFEVPNAAHTLTIENPITGGGSLTKIGAGILALSGNNTYAGATTVNQGQLRLLDGGSLSAVHIEGGSMDVAGTLAADTVFVGHNGASGTLTMTGTAAQIGSAANPTDLYVARRTVDTTTNFFGTLDLSGVDTFTAYLNDFFVGTALPVGSGQGRPQGTVTLAPNSTIHAQDIVLGHSPGVGLGGFHFRIVLGTDNTITADTLLIGGDKTTSGSTMEFGMGGGSLTLGTPTERVNVTVGQQLSWTSGGANGHLNMAGGTLDAYVDQLVVGSKSNSGLGTTHGRVTFEAGTLDVNTIILGNRTNAGDEGHVRGTFDFRGGTVLAGSILKGAGNGEGADDLAAFSFTGGTLHVDTFGSASQPFTLNQDGGTLAPGNSIGTTTIYGNYNQAAAGTLEIEIAGTGVGGMNYDLVDVYGDASLAGWLDVSLLEPFTAELGDYFDVLTTTGSLDVTGLTVTGDAPNQVFGWWDVSVLGGVDNGAILRLTAVPEPSTWLMLLAVLACGLAVRRRGAGQVGLLTLTLVLLGTWMQPVAAGIILQSSVGNSAAFEAEDAYTLGGSNWRIIDLVNPYNHPNAGGSVPVTEVLLPTDTNASGGAAILHDFGQGTSSIAVYRIHFATPGTYRWYIRDGAFEDGGVVGYGNEDSMFRPPAFDVDPISSPPGYPGFDPTYHGYSGQTEGQYGWRNTGFSYTVSEPGVVEFRIRPRETGFSIDRMLFSTTTNLNSTQLNALSNSALGDATHFDGGAGTSDWSEADNWDNGLPTANSLALIGNGQTVNLSQPGQTAHTLYIGHSGTTLPGNATLNQAAGDLTLDTLLIGQGGATGTYNIGGGTLTVSGAVQGGSGTSTMNLDHGTMDVGTGLSVDNLRVGFVQGDGAPNATLAVGAGSAVRIGDGAGTLTIARMQNTTSDSYITYGTLDLSLASATTIDVGEIRMATADARGIQHATISLGGTTTLTADTLRMADAETGSTPGGRTATLSLGQTNTFNVDTWTIGGRKSEASVRFDPDVTGGVLNLAGNDNAGANLIIGDNNTSTGVIATSIVDLSGGTFNATLDTLRIARFGTSSGSAIASLIMDADTVTANEVILAETSGSTPTNTTGTLTINGGSFTVSGAVVEGADGLTPGGGGTSTLNVNAGTMSIGTGLDVDNVRVGQNGATGSLTVAAGPVRIGSGTSHAFEVGRKTTGGTTLGTADFSGTSGVAIDVGNMNLGVQSTGTPAPTGNTTGIVTLSQNGDNSVVATTLLMGDSPNPGNTGFVSRLNLGPANNDIFANTMTVGGRKSRAEVNVPAGATVNLAARNGTGGMNLRIGFNNSGTGAVSEGTVDVRGATVNALLNSVVIGRHDRSYSPTDGGGADGVFAMDTGIVRANSIVLSVPSAAPSGGQGSADPANTKGTFFLDGGQLVAGSIARGANSVASAATFEFNAGTLAFNSFGSAALPMDLDNTGTGILNPGVDTSGAVAAAQLIGTAELFGNYVQGPDATLRIDIDELGNDLFVVHGDASLAGWLDVVLLEPFTAELGDYFDVLTTTTGSLDIAGLTVTGDAPNPVFGWWDVSVLGGVDDGAILRLTAVPEPGAWLMLLCALACAMLVRRRCPFTI